MRRTGDPPTVDVEPPWFIRMHFPASKDRLAVEHAFFFGEEPDDEQLGIRFGSVWSSSDTQAEDGARTFRIKPGWRPDAWVMYLIMAMPITMGVAMVWLGEDFGSKVGTTIAIVVLGSIAAIQFVQLMTWLKAVTGTDDYITIDKVSGEVALPRLGLAVSTSEVRRLIMVEDSDGSPSQLALLIEDKSPQHPSKRWAYVYVFIAVAVLLTEPPLLWPVSRPSHCPPDGRSP